MIIDDTDYRHINDYVNYKINNNEIIEFFSDNFIINPYHRLVRKL